MGPESLKLIAARFKVLGEPARLRILQALRAHEKTVSDLMRDTGLSQANTSRHLQLLYGLGFVERRKEGLYVLYRLADQSVLQLCDLMCGRLEQQLDADRELFS
jgi:DNA-binding transcriptional ArsR family regulator